MKDAETGTAGNPTCPNCARLAPRPAEVEAECAGLRSELERERRRVRELKARLGRNSGSSCRAPSHVPVSLGTACGVEAEVTQALEAPYREAGEAVRAANAIAFLVVHASRGSSGLRALVGNVFRGSSRAIARSPTPSRRSWTWEARPEV